MSRMISLKIRVLAGCLLLAEMLFIALGVSSVQASPTAQAAPPWNVYLPLILRPTVPPAPLVPHCVDCPRNIHGMTSHSLGLDNNNHPHIAYGGDHLYYASSNGTSWTSEVVDPSPGVGYAASLAFDPTGKPGISYYDDFNHSLKFARWNGATWSLQTVDSSPFSGYTSSLAFNNAGNPRIAYIDYDSVLRVFRIKYVEWSGSAWVFYPLNDYTGNYTGTTLSLALDHSGRAHISYWRDNYPVEGGLMYASLNGSNWTIQIVETSTDIGQNNSLAFDSQDRPHISYFDSWDGNVLYASWTGSAWTIETVYGQNLGMMKNNATSLCFGSDDMPMIALSLGESEPTQTLVWFAYKSGGSWHMDQNYDLVSSGGGRWPSLAADSDGKPHISYLDFNTGQLHYTHLTDWGPDTWTNTVVDSGGQVGQGVHLAIDRSGQPHMAYMDLTNSLLKYATWSAGAWKTMPVNDAGIKPAHGHALAVDSTGKPYIAYSDTAARKLMLASLNGSTWTSEVVADDSGSDIEKFISMAFDSNDNPHISFHDSTYASINLKYAHKVGGIWQVSEVDKNTVGITGMYNSIAIDSGGKPHISYYNWYTHSLWYASWNGSAWEKVKVDDVDSAGYYSSLALDSLDRPHICYSTRINYYVKYATLDNDTWNVHTLTPPAPGHEDDRDSICSIQIGVNDIPYISYFSRPNRHLAITHPVNGTWLSEIVDTNGDNGEHNSIGMLNGVPSIAYFNTSNRDLNFIIWKP